MKLINLNIRNFCGIKSFDLALGGKHADIYGDNATGKTTIINAFMWLFTGKGAGGMTDIDPQPLDGGNEKIHNLETSVEATVLDGSAQTVYRRELAEVWNRKRGSQTEELTGNKTAYYINSVPLKENEFKAAIAEIADAELFRMLSIVSYFATMDWKARRKALLDISGDVTDDDVIASNSELSELTSFLFTGTALCPVEDFGKIAKSKKAEIRKRIDEIPGRISENENAIPQLFSTLDALRGELAAAEKRKSELETLDATADTATVKAQKVAEIQAAITSAKSAYEAEIVKHNSEIFAKINEWSIKKRDAEDIRSKVGVELAEKEWSVDAKARKRDKLLEEYNAIKAQTYNGSDICPCCGQKLPPEKINEAVAAFNVSKSEKLSEINARGKREYSAEILAELKSDIEKLKTRSAQAIADISDAEREITALNSLFVKSAFEETEEYKAFAEQFNAAKSDTAQAENHSEEIKSLGGEIIQLHKRIGDYSVAERNKARIAELEAEQRTLGAEYAHYERGEYLCDLFTRTKVSLLDERINAKFRTLKFKLFHQQQNGGLQEICKVLIPCESGLVEYKKANNAAKINAGLEIIETLSAHYGKALPIFVDNAESVTSLAEIDNQTIRLIVSEADKALRVEV